MQEPQPRLGIDAAAPDEMKIANLAELIRSWTTPPQSDPALRSLQLATECFRHGRQSGFRAALTELRDKLADFRTAETDAIVADFLSDYGMPLNIEHERWRK